MLPWFLDQWNTIPCTWQVFTCNCWLNVRWLKSYRRYTLLKYLKREMNLTVRVATNSPTKKGALDELGMMCDHIKWFLTLYLLILALKVLGPPGLSALDQLAGSRSKLGVEIAARGWLRVTVLYFLVCDKIRVDKTTCRSLLCSGQMAKPHRSGN